MPKLTKSKSITLLLERYTIGFYLKNILCIMTRSINVFDIVGIKSENIS